MSTELWVVLGGLAGVIVTAAGGYLIARRKSSGKIATTEAETLWAESEKLRQTYRDDYITMREEATQLRTQLETVHAEILALRKDALSIKEEAVACREHVARLELQLVKVLVQQEERKQADAEPPTD